MPASDVRSPMVTDASRLSWRFADDGRTVACTVVTAGEPPVLEVTQLARTRPPRRTLIPVESLGPHSQLLPLTHGRVLICHHRHGGQQIDLVTTEGPTVRRLLTTEQPGLRLIALPDQQGAALAIAISNGTDGRSTIWKVTCDGALRPIAVTPGVFTGGIWLDCEGRRFGGELGVDGRPCDGVAVDLATGDCDPYLSISERSNDRLVAFCPNTGVLVISTDLTGEVRLGVGRPDHEPIKFPPDLHRQGHEVRLLALDREVLCSPTKRVSARDCRCTTGAPAERRRSTPLRAWRWPGRPATSSTAHRRPRPRS